MSILRSPWAVAGLLALLTLALLLPWLGAVPFDDPGEGQHAEIAREIVLSGDWLTLRLTGIRYFDKPPLLYWLIAAGFKAMGISEWVARLPAALGAAAAVGGTTLLGARLLGPGAGALAGAGLLSCALFAAFGRYVRPETLFVAAIQWGFTGLLLALAPYWFRGGAAPVFLGVGSARVRLRLTRPPQTRPPDDEGPRARWWAVVGCAALGVAALSKDVFGLVGPLGAVALALVLGGRLYPMGRWLPPLGLAVLLILGLGWYALTTMRNPGFLWYTVVDNHLLNALQLRQFPDEDVPLSSLEFLLVAGLGAFPWILPAALEVGQLARRRAWRFAEDIPWVALALWAVGIFLVFTLSAFKLPHYGLPAYPAIALLAARWWSRREPPDRRPALWHLAVFGLLAAILGAAALTDGRGFMDTIFSATDVYSRKEALATQIAPLPAWSALRPLVWHTALVFALAAALLAAAAVWRAGRLAACTVAVTMLAIVPSIGQALGLVSTARAVSAMAAEIRLGWSPDGVLIHEGPIENSGALELYAGVRPVLVEARRSVLGIGSTFPEAADTFWDADRFTRVWLSNRRALLVTTRDPARSLVAKMPRDRVHLLASRQGRWLWSNTPPRA
ncbi:MAG TPA: glycosyltransferase family 39 protein [Methylomirabilota bacterium]|nr:glycosyltransferase family 39 protein [Methylomirabilota bacterium]